MKIGIYSLQIFLQNFYRNVPWVVLYQTYLFCYKLLIWLVTMATNRQNLWKKNQKSTMWGIKLKLCSIVSYISLYKIIAFIAVAHALWLPWQLKISIDLQWEKWKLRFIAISLQIFWQKFYRNVPWVVLYQAYKFCPNHWSEFDWMPWQSKG